jgi:capsular exopolysaccharide synthesis family protein
MNRLIDKEASFSDYVGVITKRKWLILILILIAVVITAIFSYTTTPLYEASTVLRVRYQPTIFEQQSGYYYFWSPNFLNTELAVIRSRAISLDVISKQKKALITEPKDWIEYFTTFKLIEKTVPGNYKISFINDREFNVLKGDGTLVGRGENGVEFDQNGLNFTLTYPSPKEGLTCSFTILNFAPMIADLKSRITVTSTEGVDLVKISITGSNPEQITREANLITESYIEESYKSEKGQTVSTREFIEGQLKRIKDTLTDLEDRENESMKSEGIYNIDKNLADIIDKISYLEREKADYEIQLYALARERERTVGLLYSNDDSFIELVNNPAFTDKNVSDAYYNYITLVNEREKELQFYTEEHPNIKQLDAEIESMKKNIRELLINSLNTGNIGFKKRELESKIDEILGRIAQYDKDLEGYPSKSLALVRIEREKKANENIYDLLLSRYQEIKIEEAMKKTNIMIVDPAISPIAPIKPNHRRDLLMGFILGIVIGLLSTIIIELLDNTIHTPEEAERFIKLPIVGIIPTPLADATKKPRLALIDIILKRKKEEAFGNLFFEILDNPQSPFSEAFRGLRTNIISTVIDKQLRSILVTSVERNEGKTTISINLAISFALTGRKTLLVDTDLRKPEHHRIFKMKSSPGVSNVCLKELVLKSAIRETNVENLFVLTAGRQVPNPAELLDSQIMKDIFQGITRDFDIAIFDSPPVLPVADPLIIGKQVDATFIVILADVTPFRSIEAMISSLSAAEIKPKGIILNAMSYVSTYGKYRYKYYYYKYE